MSSRRLARARRWPSRAGFAGLCLAVMLQSPPAPAQAWARARDPRVALEADATARVEALLLKYRDVQRGRRMLPDDMFGPGALVEDLYLSEARDILDEASAAISPDPAFRLRLGEVLYEQKDCERAVTVLETVARSDGAAPLREEAFRQLAVCDAHLGRHREEIEAYESALALEPHGSERAVLLANQAESYMLEGDLATAIHGYRAAMATLAAMTPYDLAAYSPTTLWGLAVALDRSGDLDGALGTIRLARTYDPADRQLRSSGWFYVPDYDEAWYAALGHWVAARDAAGALRIEEYQSAVSAWESYLARASESDLWLPIARARLRACQEERRVAQRRSPRASKTR